MEDFHSLSNRISGLQEDIFTVKKQTSVLASDIKEDDRKLEELNNSIYNRLLLNILCVISQKYGHCL